ncbi:MAG: hypothetical protein LBV26_05015 [Bacteroidales bacterium]|jgi:hypothetical protein|nr:hypothetical protein [Bacteroidales bacterium]
MPLIQQDYTLLATNRTDIREEVTRLFLAEPAGTGTGRLSSKAEYTVDNIPNTQYKIVIKRPATLNKGFDFTVNVTGLYFKEGENHSTPSHNDIISLLKSAQRSVPQSYKRIKSIINDIYGCNFYDGTVSTGIQFTGYSMHQHPIEIILLAIKWLFIEQDITYWNWSGRNMFMNALRNNSLA